MYISIEKRISVALILDKERKIEAVDFTRAGLAWSNG